MHLLSHRTKLLPRDGFHVLTSYCLVVMLGLSLVTGSFFILDRPHELAAKVVVGDHPTPHQPLDIPLDADSAPAETQDEKDIKDSLDDEWGKFAGASVTSCRSLGSLNSFSLSPHTRSFHNRSTISLFVLHHAWKSSVC
jgi:hypothetical protein